MLSIFFLTSCSGGVAMLDFPAQNAKEFVVLMSEGESEKAIDHVCFTEGIILLPDIKFNWQNDKYETLSTNSDKTNALVRVRGSIRIPADDIRTLSNDVLQIANQIPELQGSLPTNMDFQDIPVPTVALNIDFQDLVILKQDGNWCVDYYSLGDFFVYLVEMISEQLLSL